MNIREEPFTQEWPWRKVRPRVPRGFDQCIGHLNPDPGKGAK